MVKREKELRVYVNSNTIRLLVFSVTKTERTEVFREGATFTFHCAALEDCEGARFCFCQGRDDANCFDSEP